MAAKKTAPRAPRVPREPTIPELIDELGALDQALSDLHGKEKRAKLVREQIVEALKLKPKQAVTSDGTRYCVQIAEAGFKREIVNMPKLFQILGQKTFLAECGFPLGRAGDLLSETQAAQIISETQTGPRKIKTLQRLAA